MITPIYISSIDLAWSTKGCLLILTTLITWNCPSQSIFQKQGKWSMLTVKTQETDTYPNCKPYPQVQKSFPDWFRTFDLLYRFPKCSMLLLLSGIQSRELIQSTEGTAWVDWFCRCEGSHKAIHLDVHFDSMIGSMSITGSERSQTEMIRYIFCWWVELSCMWGNLNLVGVPVWLDRDYRAKSKSRRVLKMVEVFFYGKSLMWMCLAKFQQIILSSRLEYQFQAHQFILHLYGSRVSAYTLRFNFWTWFWDGWGFT